MIGNVAVDCRFLFTQSQWGLIGGRGPGGDNREPRPAGILYLDLDFDQPADTRLRSATVLITLKGNEKRSGKIRYGSTVVNHDNRSFAAHFTDCYGPKQFYGRERSTRILREKNLTPNFSILGYGAGGIGLTTKQDLNRVSRWKFTGHLDTSNNTLKWTLEENELESQSLHRNNFHTAFALEHNASEFYMTVEVSGKLLSLSDQLKNRMKRFGGGKSKVRETVTTKFQWTNDYSCPRRLDKVAKGLSDAMEYKNMYETPVEMPDTLPAKFQSVAGRSGPVIGAFPEDRPSETDWPGLPGLPNVPHGLNEVTLDDLASAAGFPRIVHAVPATARGRPYAYQAPELSSRTLVGSGGEDSIVHGFRVEPRRKAAKAKPEGYTDDEQSDIEMIIWLTRMPLIAVILRLFAAIMGFHVNQVDDGTMTRTNSENEAGNTANDRFEAYSSIAGDINTQTTTGSGATTVNQKSKAKRRSHSGLQSALGRTEENRSVVISADEAGEFPTQDTVFGH